MICEIPDLTFLRATELVTEQIKGIIMEDLNGKLNVGLIPLVRFQLYVCVQCLLTALDCLSKSP